MHELSIASDLVELVTEAAENANAQRVTAVHLRLGVLAGVNAESLRFCYGVATQGTLLEGSRLDVLELPIVIHCLICNRDVEIADVPTMACPDCGTLSASVHQGRELEVESIEIQDRLVE